AETRPVILDRSLLGRSVDDVARSDQQLPLAAFRPTTFGDTIEAIVPRNAFFGQGVKNVDLGLYKNFPLRQSGQRVTFRLEAYNVYNGVQVDYPTTDINSATFGRIVSTSSQYSPRVVQLALRFIY